MSKNIRRVILKVGLVVSASLFGFAAVTTKITKENRVAISNELGQPIYKTETSGSNELLFKSRFNQLGGEDGLIQAGKDLAKKIQAEGTVLLSNKNNALPLKENAKVSLFGATSMNHSVGGRGSSQAGEGAMPAVSLKDGLTEAGLQVNDVLYDYYSKASTTSPWKTSYQFDDMPFDHVKRGDRKNKPISESPDVLASIAEYSDAAIYIITRTAGESSDIVLNDDENELKLKENEINILSNLTKLKTEGKIKKIVLLLNTTNQIQEDEFKDFAIDSTLWIGHTGITGTLAIGEILNGKINPSGHLVDTFWYDHMDNPVMKNFGAFKYSNRSDFASQLPGDAKSDGYGTYVAYQEGIYVGYRYAETRYTDLVEGVLQNVGDFSYQNTISAPFGFGLSYTQFELSNQKVSYDADKREYTVSVDVENTGDKAGKEVVQIYLQKPYTAYDQERNIEKPAVELVGYEKTKLLAPNEKITVSVKVAEENFKVYDAKDNKTYIVTEGDYLLTAAEDAHKAANNFLAYKGKTVANSPAMTADGNKDFVYKVHKPFDGMTYSKSAATGNDITNIFDDADINKLEIAGDNQLEFMSRSNWTKNLTKDLKLTQEMVDHINAQLTSSSIQKANDPYPTYGADNNLKLIQLLIDPVTNEKYAFDDPIWDQFLDQLTFAETAELVSTGLRMTIGNTRLGKPATLDHNGPTGLTKPYNSSENGLAYKTNDPLASQKPVYYPSVPVLAASYSKELAHEYGDLLGEDALWSGFNGLYGIGLNTHRSPYSGRHFEYYSEDPLLAGTIASAEVIGLQEHGCNAYIKHMALNDQETQRFGIQVWSNEQALREISLKPFELAVTKGGAMNVMASFSRIGLDFSPASKALLTDFLRTELGLKGFVVTDMYSAGYKAESMPLFLLSGTDVPDGSVDVSIWDAYSSGYSNVAYAMREAAHRIMYATLHSNAMNGFNINTKIIELTPPWEVAVNTVISITSVLFGGMVVWAVVEFVLENKNKFLRKKN